MIIPQFSGDNTTLSNVVIIDATSEFFGSAESNPVAALNGQAVTGKGYMVLQNTEFSN